MNFIKPEAQFWSWRSPQMSRHGRQASPGFWSLSDVSTQQYFSPTIIRFIWELQSTVLYWIPPTFNDSIDFLLTATTNFLSTYFQLTLLHKFAVHHHPTRLPARLVFHPLGVWQCVRHMSDIYHIYVRYIICGENHLSWKRGRPAQWQWWHPHSQRQGLSLCR